MKLVRAPGSYQAMTTSIYSVEQCAELCLRCYGACVRTAVDQSLKQSGSDERKRCLRLMINCADICKTAADFILSSSDLYEKVCAVCAEVCDACAKRCEEMGGMDDCTQACRTCAHSCRQVAASQSERLRSDQREAVGAPM